MCLFPTIRHNKKYGVTAKNGGVIPAVHDTRVLYAPTKCGRCIECMKAKARDWQIRLTEEIKHDKSGVFVTLTFKNEAITEIGRAHV